jgi:hypothetical protein
MDAHRFDDLIERLDARLVRIDEHMLRQEDVIARSVEAAERGRETAERNREAFERNSAVLDSLPMRFDEGMRVFVATLNDMRDEIRAQTQAILRVIDRLDGGESVA